MIRNYCCAFAVHLITSIMLFGQSYSDCQKSYRVCEMKSYHFEEIRGNGNLQDELGSSLCTMDQIREMNSVWMTFQIAESGTLVFTINPEDEMQDVDFILYKSEQDCNDLIAKRCMLTGETFGAQFDQSNCVGSTGLLYSSEDLFEDVGCRNSDDNYLKYMEVTRGDKYYLFINNSMPGKNISISFDGSADFVKGEQCMPEPTQDLQVLSIVPNPANDKIEVAISSVDEEYELIILNTTGDIVRKIRSHNFKNPSLPILNVQDFSAGQYILLIKQKGGISSKQFIKI